MGMKREDLERRHLLSERHQLGELSSALRSSFLNYEELKHFARYQLGLKLEHFISGTRSLNNALYELLVEFDRQDRLEFLVRRVRRVKPGNPALRDYEKKFMAPFTTERLRTLELAVRGLDLRSDQLIGLATNYSPRGWRPETRPGETPSETFSRIIEGLANLPKTSSGEHPLLKFVWMLITDKKALNEPIDELQKWYQETEGAKNSEITCPLRSLHLFVKCDPGPYPVTQESELSVVSWCWQIRDDLRRVCVNRVPDKETRWTLSELPELLAWIRSTPMMVDLLSRVHDDMTVEVCLPMDLLSEDIDGWPLSTGEVEQALRERVGCKYKVVVRSFERLYDPSYGEYWDTWQKKCERLEGDAATPAEWIDPNLSCEEFSKSRCLSESLCFVSCLRCAEEFLELSIESGTPAVLWLRMEGAAVTEAEKFLEPLLEGPIAELPDRIHRARQGDERTPLAQYITLLWDCYEWLPPDVTDHARLCSPSEG